MRHLKWLGLGVILICACQNNTNPIQNKTSATNPEKSLVDTIVKKKVAQPIPKDPQVEEKPSQEKSNEEKKVIKPKRNKKPKRKVSLIKFDSTTIHLPDMVEGEVADLEFRFWNEGDGPLTIDEVDVTCGCTTPSIPFLDILPGDSSNIRIQYKSVGKSGLQQPEITVKSNGKPKYTVLKIEVFIKENLLDTTYNSQDTLPH